MRAIDLAFLAFMLSFIFLDFEPDSRWATRFLVAMLMRVAIFFSVGWVNHDKPRIWYMSGGYAFCVSNFLAAVVYYILHYDPSGTTKPAWTDYLG